jgi:hypothetical protein
MAIVRLKGLGKLRNFYDLIGTRTRDLPACRIAPQPSTIPHAQTHFFCVNGRCLLKHRSIFTFTFFNYFPHNRMVEFL